MSKGSSHDDSNPKPIQTDIPADTQKGNTNQLIGMAAEQLAILLWKTWLHKKSIDGRGSGGEEHPKKPLTVS